MVNMGFGVAFAAGGAASECAWYLLNFFISVVCGVVLLNLLMILYNTCGYGIIYIYIYMYIYIHMMYIYTYAYICIYMMYVYSARASPGLPLVQMQCCLADVDAPDGIYLSIYIYIIHIYIAFTRDRSGG